MLLGYIVDHFDERLLLEFLDLADLSLVFKLLEQVIFLSLERVHKLLETLVFLDGDLILLDGHIPLLQQLDQVIVLAVSFLQPDLLIKQYLLLALQLLPQIFHLPDQLTLVILGLIQDLFGIFVGLLEFLVLLIDFQLLLAALFYIHQLFALALQLFLNLVRHLLQVVDLSFAPLLLLQQVLLLLHQLVLYSAGAAWLLRQNLLVNLVGLDLQLAALHLPVHQLILHALEAFDYFLEFHAHQSNAVQRSVKQLCALLADVRCRARAIYQLPLLGLVLPRHLQAALQPELIPPGVLLHLFQPDHVEGPRVGRGQISCIGAEFRQLFLCGRVRLSNNRLGLADLLGLRQLKLVGLAPMQGIIACALRGDQMRLALGHLGAVQLPVRGVGTVIGLHRVDPWSQERD